MVKEINKRILYTGLIIVVVTCLANLFIRLSFMNLINLIIGVIAGMLLSMVKIIMMSKDVNKSVDMKKETAQKFATIMYAVRYILTGIVLIVAIKYSLQTFAMMAITLILTTKISVYSFISKNNKEKNKK